MPIAIQNPTKEECLKALRECPPQKIELIEDLSVENSVSTAKYRAINSKMRIVEVSGVRKFKTTTSFSLDEFINVVEVGDLLIRELIVRAKEWNLHPEEAPEIGQRVLIWNPKTEDVEIAYYCHYLEVNEGHPVFEVWESGKPYYFTGEIHWMPLPSAPDF